MVDNKLLNRYSLYYAIFFNSAVLTGVLYFLSDYNANAQSIGDRTSARIAFFEDNTGRIENGRMVLHFNYTFTHDKQDDIEFSSTGLKFQKNGTVILN